jgi:hypothetical protein
VRVITDILGNPLQEGVYVGRFGRKAARFQISDDIESGGQLVRNLDIENATTTRLDEMPNAHLVSWVPEGVEDDPNLGRDHLAGDHGGADYVGANHYLVMLSRMEQTDSDLAEFRKLLNTFQSRVAEILGIGLARDDEARLVNEFLMGLTSPTVAIMRAQNLLAASH